MTSAEEQTIDCKNPSDEVSKVNWHVLSTDDATAEISTDGTAGISKEEAAKRLERYGPNELTEKKNRSLLQKVWDQVNNVLVFILAVVAIVSMVKAITTDKSEERITSWIEVGLIVGVIVLNTIIGIKQEGSAEQAAKALKAMLSSDATVIRNGQKQSINAREIVPGDLVVLSLGDRVPADLRLVEVNNLACQEAALTGESIAVEKFTAPIEAENPSQVPLGDRKNMCFSATLVAQGEGIGIAVSTGDSTEIGTINALVNTVEAKKTAVLEQIDMVSKFIALFVVLTGAVTFCVAYFWTEMEALDAISIALVCAVAMIPEGLAAIVTLSYAYAVSNMASQNAIIRVLPAVETLGSVTVICSDKTGTLTKNEMSLVAFVTSNTRYRYDTDSKNRTNANFVRDDAFMALHANQVQHQKGGSITLSMRERGIYREEGGGSERSAGSSSFLSRFSLRGSKRKEDTDIEKGNVEKFIVDVPCPSALAPCDLGPVPNGSSPGLEFIQGAMSGGVLCSKSELGKDGGCDGEIGNPTELAIIRAAYFAGVDVDGMRKGSPEITLVPFSSEYKFMATVHEALEAIDGPGLDGNLVVHVKGAPDRLLPLCSHQAKAGVVYKDQSEPLDTQYWFEQAATLSSHGLRVLALCRGIVPGDCVEPGQQLKPEFVRERGGPWLTMVGLCAIMDPPRPECVGAIAEAHDAGVRVAMITGDHKETALAIGDMLGLVDDEHSEAITGPELDAMDDDKLREVVMEYNVFARSSPENKIQIVKALQAEKQVVSMTGDGVNDAPALKAADMGVAMGKEGTDVAREAAEMILADDNFATIVVAVREGRVVWDNLRKVLLVNTPVNNAQGMSVLFALIFGLEDSPLTAIQILCCNLICAVTLGFVLAVEPAEEGIMLDPPRRVGKRLIGRFLLLRIVIGTIVLVTCTVGAVFWAQDLGYSFDEIRSQASNTLTFGAISICLSARFSYNSSLHPRIFRGNKYCWYTIGLVVLLQIGITYIPGLNDVVFQMAAMDATQWGLVGVGMVSTLLVMEAEKAMRRRLKAKGANTDDRVSEEDAVALNAYAKGTKLLPNGASHLKLSNLRASE